MPRLAVLLNDASGTGTQPANGADGARSRLEARFRDAGCEATIHAIAPGRLDAAIAEALATHPIALVAGGGDGTVSAVAGAASRAGLPLGILPLGTLNHFAKDLGIPLDLDAAADVVLAGATRRVDLGEVNGRTFVNNSSLGLYPRIVQLRERYGYRGRIGKALAALWATLVVLRRRPFHAVRVVTEAETVVRRTPFVFVGNNEYVMNGLSAGTRASLSDGKIALYLMNAGARASLVALAFRVLTAGAEATRELDLFCVTEALIETRRRRLRVALDGEVLELATPLRYRVLPGALEVFAPPAADRPSSSSATRGAS